MKNRRFYAMFLLAALALVQVRFAFAACEMGLTSPAVAAANGCGHAETMIGGSGAQPPGQISCEPVRCASAYAAQEAKDELLADGQPPPVAFPASAQSYRAHAPSVPLRLWAASPPHTHPRLIYVFGRLLI